MKTYVSILISSESDKASNISEVLNKLGFETTLGGYDFVYDWHEDVTTAEVLNFMDDIQNKLKGMNIRFNISTIKD